MISEAGPEAIDAIMEVMEQAFDPIYGEAWNRAQCLGILGLPGVWMSVACTDGYAHGFALGRIVLDDAELLLIAVRPLARGKGFGKALLDDVIRTSATRGAAQLHLEVRDGNPALELYRQNGFQPIGRRKSYYTGHLGQAFDALTLTRPISG